MPELPQMQALAERLGDALTGKVLEGVEPLGFSALKTVVPRARVVRSGARSSASAGGPST